ncbi:DUF418 domain-containing protein [Streptomyces specialis]|uniref:DUF418 domain-containing protein n=1 Tax=Streptomyces specialis TaxID=498367 RepID=UPI00073F9212|nr:DUF418 domain-containing protein [Streptomyces specialis]
MTQDLGGVRVPAGPIAPAGTPSARSAAGVGRLIGLDLARGLAVFGMYAAHVGPMPTEGGVTGWVMELFHGRSSALFAVLAGLALVLIAGRRVPRTGRDGRRAAARIAIRAVVLLALGSALTASGTVVEVILAYYGVYFLLALPFRRLPARTLALAAVVWALLGPPLLHALSEVIYAEAMYTEDWSYRGWAATIDGHDPLAAWSGEGVVALLCAGGYPALTWMPYVLAGMALGRLDLAAPAVRVRLARLGAAMAVLGYGGSWLALRLFPQAVEATGAPHAWWSDVDVDADWDTWWWLLVAAPHSQTTPSLIANTGVALAVIAGALILVDRFAPARRLARPVIAVGTMSLTAYVGHVVAVWWLDLDLTGAPLSMWLGFVGVAALVATVWLRFFRRGPLEYLVNAATAPARHLR